VFQGHNQPRSSERLIQAPRPSTRLTVKDATMMYKSVGMRDADHLFEWLHNLYTWICLPCVSLDYRIPLGEDKTKVAIFDVLADDLADNYATRSRFLLEEFVQIPWGRASDKSDPYLDLGKKLWNDVIESIQAYPRYKDFEKPFFFDLRQVLTAMDYSSLVNMVGMNNAIELDAYIPHGCMVMLALDMDLMCSPDFDLAELGRMRSVTYLAEKVAHIGNMLVTYPRELVERDLSCPLISLAINRGVIKREDLGDPTVLPRLRVLEPIFRRRAGSYIDRIAKYEKQVHSVNISGFHNFLSQLLEKYWPSGGKSDPLTVVPPLA
jgi:hypothetical protein